MQAFVEREKRVRMPGPADERLPAVKSRFARQRAGCGGLQRLISMTSLPATSFRALLSGLSKRLFYGEAALTNESLVERLWGSINFSFKSAIADILVLVD